MGKLLDNERKVLDNIHEGYSFELTCENEDEPVIMYFGSCLSTGDELICIDHAGGIVAWTSDDLASAEAFIEKKYGKVLDLKSVDLAGPYD